MSKFQAKNILTLYHENLASWYYHPLTEYYYKDGVEFLEEKENLKKKNFKKKITW